MEWLQNEFIVWAVGGFMANGFITQFIRITPTKKDDKVLETIQFFIKALTGTFGLTKK